MDYNTLLKRFPRRRLTKVVNTTKLSLLRFTEIMVYSCLVDRAIHAKGARQKQVSRATGLHESTAVPTALLSLVRHGLVEKRGVYWWATEPTTATLPWFKYRKGTEGQKWFRRFSYWWTGIRKTKARLTATQTSLYFKLLNLSDYTRRITVRGLARLLGVDVKTIIQGIRKLKAENLLDEDLVPTDPTPEQVKWLRVRREKPPFLASDHFGSAFDSEAEEAKFSKPLVDRAGQLLIDGGFSETHVIDYFRSVLTTGKRWVVIYSFMAKFEEFLSDIQHQHQQNVAAGRYTKAKNCRGLLKVETETRLRALLMKRW
jgi:predicted DNA-binding transcriptional regulator